MKKLLFVLIIAFTLASCSENQPLKQNQMESVNVQVKEQKDTFIQRIDKVDSLRKINEKKSHEEEFPIGEPTYTNLVLFIQKHGFSVGDGEKQYTFFDSKGNRHALITIKSNNNPKGPVVQISVWAYYQGIKDLDHFFGYVITRDRVYPDVISFDGEWKHFDDVYKGVSELVDKANNENLSGEEEDH